VVAEIRPVLGALTRGLSALFWGLPLALVLSVQSVTSMRLGPLELLNLLAPSAGFGLLLYGLVLLGALRMPRHRAWVAKLDRARFLALTCLGLSPFLHWYQRMPQTDLFSTAVALLALFSVMLLLSLNGVLRRLAEALPDALLVIEAKAFTRLNMLCLLLLPVVTAGWFLAWRWAEAPLWLAEALRRAEPFRLLVLLFLTLLPLSMTMSLLWKTKETLLGLGTAGR